MKTLKAALKKAQKTSADNKNTMCAAVYNFNEKEYNVIVDTDYSSENRFKNCEIKKIFINGRGV